MLNISGKKNVPAESYYKGKCRWKQNAWRTFNRDFCNTISHCSLAWTLPAMNNAWRFANLNFAKENIHEIMRTHFFKVFIYFFRAGTSNEWKKWKPYEKWLAPEMHISSWQVELTGRRQMLWYPWKCNGLWSFVARTSTVPWDSLELFCEYVSPTAFLKCCWIQASNLREALDTSQAPPGMNSGSFPYLVVVLPSKKNGILSLVTKQTTKTLSPTS